MIDIEKQDVNENRTPHGASDSHVRFSPQESDVSGRVKFLMRDDSNVAFARRVKMSESGLRKILKGQKPNLKTLENIAAACGVTVNWLISGEVAPTPGAAIQKAFAMAVTPGVENHTAEVMESLLVVCLQACAKVYGEPFQAQSAAVQTGYAADLYNRLVRMSAAMGGSMELMQRLELDGIAQQLQLFIKLGQARKFPPPPEFMSVMW